MASPSIQRLTSWLSPTPLPAALVSPFHDSVTEANQRRLRIFVPLMVVVHLIHIVAFWLGDAERQTLEPTLAVWRDGLVRTHLVTIVVDVVLWALTIRVGARLGPMAGAAMGLVYLLHGAVIVGVDQLVIKSSSVYLGYAIGVSVVVVLHPRQAIAIYSIGAGAFVAALQLMQPDVIARMASIPPGISISVIAVTLTVFLSLARRRDFALQATIDRQRSELEALNVGLETRIKAAVDEAVARSKEIEALNAQLQANVRDRSAVLTQALAKLALRHAMDGSIRLGTVLGDRFEVKRPIGEGGMGVVYAGVDRSTGGAVAIKVIQAASARQLDALRRFLLEVRATATIAHPAVVRMIDVGISDDGLLYQAQELVDGVTLEDHLAGGALEPQVVAQIGAVICDALAAAHRLGVVHRDVKPANVMLTRSAPGLKLLDFGIAKLYDAVAGDVTATGIILGTPEYMAPEQVEGGADVTTHADVYALGVMLYQMCAEKLPFDDVSISMRLLRRTRDDAPDVRDAAADVPAALAVCISSCLVRDASARPSAADVGVTLAHIAATFEGPALWELPFDASTRAAPTPPTRPMTPPRAPARD